MAVYQIKVYFILSMVILGSNALNAQVQCDKEYYVAALAYLRVDPDFDRLLATTFGVNRKKRNQKVVTLSVSDWTRFVPLASHESAISKDSALSGNKILSLSPASFYDRYSFSPSRCDFLTKFGGMATSDAVLVFSRPFDEYLLAEVFDKRLSANGTARNGQAISILFIFRDGIVNKSIYNIITF